MIALAIITVLCVPLGLFLSVKRKSITIALKTGYLFVVLVVAGIVGYLMASTAYAPLNKGVAYSAFIRYYVDQLDAHVGIYTWLVAAGFAILGGRGFRFAEPRVVLLLRVALAASIVLGPLNPALFPVYDTLMGSSHSNRIMYAFPFYLSLAYFSGVGLREFRTCTDRWRRMGLFLSVSIMASATFAHIIGPRD